MVDRIRALVKSPPRVSSTPLHPRSAMVSPMDHRAAPVAARMPAIFIGHGTPFNALQDNRFTAAWKAYGQRIPRPKAVLAVSAHWYIGTTAVTSQPMPRTVHDFFGFP